MLVLGLGLEERERSCIRASIYNLPVSIPFAEYAARVQEHLERDWGIPVVTRDIPDPLTGDLDGAEIDVDYAITAASRVSRKAMGRVRL